MNDYSNAKKIFDFYMAKLEEDNRPESVYAQQYANLRIFRQRTEAILNSLESYDIEITQ